MPSQNNALLAPALFRLALRKRPDLQGPVFDSRYDKRYLVSSLNFHFSFMGKYSDFSL
ncbi:hypothetical protein (plasmid) [Erwinia amylovora ATCC 49946]|uniref:Uncharacterized protein n=1 Tax=Erwinia amylovora TaxID=552 RepID=A0A0P0ZH22_ERWAM|nr:hypothetical protein [Erwinia amylovora ATCC 49946]CDK23771.1 hypothetical protein LA635_p1038 [Erwinia amylovora LA635]CDK23815.1 hypothetical protein LA636_p1037 [Erwinia amylovora LA636]CDK23865.1 hypothetical protein LA637_p1038 [Erwinia amylovora LA637]CDM08163.1 hypothetical protein EAMY692_p20037 [Erwinia amylovora]